MFNVIIILWLLFLSMFLFRLFNDLQNLISSNLSTNLNFDQVAKNINDLKNISKKGN